MKRLGIVVFPGFQILDLAAAGVFEVANLLTDRKTYDVRLFSESGGSVVSSSGITVDTQAFADTAFDTLIIAGDVGVATPSEGLVKFALEAANASRRIAS